MVGKYKVITLCGSTRFKDEFMEAQKRLTLEGNIVISVGLFGHSGDNEVWENMDEGTLTKTKEMLAYLTDRRGALVDTRELQAVLWENTSGHDSYYKQLRKDLFDTLRQKNCLEMIINKRGSIGIFTEYVSCDYYDYLRGDKAAAIRFNGEYMRQYSWAESTLASLLRKEAID